MLLLLPLPVQEVKKEIDDAVEKAKASPVPPASELWNDIYKGVWVGGGGVGGQFQLPPLASDICRASSLLPLAAAAPLGMKLRGLDSTHMQTLPS